MADRTFNLEVITPGMVVYGDEVAALNVHGGDGYLGILPLHAPLITTIEPGLLNITGPNDKEIKFSLGTGFMEVRENKVVIIADTAEKQ